MNADIDNEVNNQLPPPPAEIPYVPTPEERADWYAIESEIAATMR